MRATTSLVYNKSTFASAVGLSTARQADTHPPAAEARVFFNSEAIPKDWSL